MTTADLILQNLDLLPEDLKQEVLDFVLFLQHKQAKLEEEEDAQDIVDAQIALAEEGLIPLAEVKHELGLWFMAYEIGFKSAALRQLRKLNTEVQVAVIRAVEDLANNPRPEGCKKLKGELSLYRIRVAGNYRVIYEIQDKQLVIAIVKIGHRRDVYRP